MGLAQWTLDTGGCSQVPKLLKLLQYLSGCRLGKGHYGQLGRRGVKAFATKVALPYRCLAEIGAGSR